MQWKRMVDEELHRQRLSIARKAVLESFRAAVPAGTTMGELLAEIEADEALRAAFLGVTLDELRAALGADGSSASPYGPRGPDRRRGVTADRIVAFVTDHPGCSLGDVARTLGLERGAVTSQMRSLRAQGRLRTEGRERKFRYYAG